MKKNDHFYRGVRAMNEVEGLPVKTLPRHLDTDVKDETTLAAAYSRLGAGDVEVKEHHKWDDVKKRLKRNDKKTKRPL